LTFGRKNLFFFSLTFICLIIRINAQTVELIPEQNIYRRYSSQFVVNPFENLPMFGSLGDSLAKYRGFLKNDYIKTHTSINIDDNWEFITISQKKLDQQFKIPYTSPVSSYFKNKIKYNRSKYFAEQLPISKQKGASTANQRNKALELVGVDIGGLGRASLRVNGNVNVAGKMIYQDQELAVATQRESQNTRFDIDQKQHFSVEGTIGDRISVSLDQDSERDFDWENNIKITYTGREDEILQKVEAGNTSLALPATQFVTFTGNNQGLFGFKAISKLGPVDITSVAAIEQTKKEKKSYKPNGQSQTQKIKDYDYVKNQHFFIHEWFRNGVSTIISGQTINLPPYYPLDFENGGLHSRGNVRVADFELYKLDQSNNPATDVGVAYIDPATPNENETYNKEGTFLRMERDIDYTLDVDLGTIRLKSRSQDQILACHYLLVTATNDTVTAIGHGLLDSDQTLSLKMLKPQSPHPNHPTWDLMFKNVYYLGATNIDTSGFAVRIIYNHGNIQSDRDANGTFIKQFGLDNENSNGASIPDEIIDLNQNLISLRYGEIYFPALLPFVAEADLTGGNTNTELEQILGEGKMYTSTVHSEYTGDSRFTIEADYANLSSTINLGFMIAKDSEDVRADGARLTKNQDYTIDYFSGTINLIKQDLNPNADIEVKYEKNELVSFDKKMILGSRAQMDLGTDAFIGATALYYNQSVIDEKIEVGYEPMRNFIWDINGRYGRDLEVISKSLNRLPLIETDAISKIAIEGEFAQVFPNPNSISNSATGDANGVAYIDDFEGSKRSNSIGIRFEKWEASSAPIEQNTGKLLNQKNRTKMYWYSPFGQVLTSSIWPQQSTSTQANNNTTDILVLRNKIRPHQANISKDSLWAGIITPLHSGNYDQTQSKFFEIWIQGNSGNISVDLGKISEDVNSDGALNTEDRPDAGIVQGNNQLDNGEDVGLDGARDIYEDGWGGALDSTAGLTYQQLLSSGSSLINPDVEDINDPNGDNWKAENNTNNYPEINGTQGNGGTSRGTYPDTEDLDGSGFLDKTNNYFTKTFPLDRSKYFVEETKTDDGEPTGWQKFQIPLTHFEKVNNVDWSEIRYMRLVWSGMDSTAALGIAKIELVGNAWQEIGTAQIDSESYNNADSTFSISVVNTDENPSYTPPDGVRGEYNPLYGTRSKEQSLVLNFDKLPANSKGAAKKTLFALTGERAQSYLTYDKLKMYVHGEMSNQWIGKEESDVKLFLQFGLGDQFYEITQPVYSGWDEELGRNSINLDLDWLTNLKLQDTESIKLINTSDIFIDSADVKQYLFSDEQGNLTGKEIRIKGSPALSRIQHLIVGIKNSANEPISGQVLIDELRLSGIKREKGIAMRVQTNLKLADIGNTSVIFSRKDADFHVLQQRLGSNRNNRDIRVNTNLQIHKFLPETWGLSIPLNITYSNANDRPKYYPGSDARVNESAVPDSILNVAETMNISTSFTKSRKSKNKWIKYTLDDITASFSSNRANTANEIMKEVRNESYSGKLTYGHAFARDKFIKPLKWFKILPLIGNKLGNMNFYYTPTNINAGIDIVEKLVQKNSRVGGRSADEYNLGLNRNLNLKYQVTDNFSIDYGRGSKSDMDEYRAKIGQAIQKFDPGIVTNLNENLSANFNPILAEWLKPNFSYSAAYRWDKPRNSIIDGANIGTQLRFSSNLALNIVSILETIYKPKKTSSNRSRANQRGVRSRIVDKGETSSDNQDNELDEKKEFILEEEDELRQKGKDSKLEVDAEKEKSKLGFLGLTHKILKKINPINMTYSSNLNRTGLGVQGEVPVGYKFGWTSEHGLPHSENVGTNTGQWNFVRNLSIRSGFAISTKAKVSLNYIQELGINRTGGTDLEIHSSSRNYFAYGEKLENGLPITNWTLRVTGIERWPIIKKIAKTASLEHAFSGKEVRSWKIEGVDNVPVTPFFGVSNFNDEYGDFLTQSRINVSYSPLLGLSMSLAKGVSLNIRHNRSKIATKTPTGLNLKNDKSYSLSSNYTHKGGFKIPLPFFDRYKAENTMNFTFNADYNKSQTHATKNTEDLTELDSNESFKIGLRISYTFSKLITGAMIFEYRESDTRIGKKIDRDIGFDVNIAISG